MVHSIEEAKRAFDAFARLDPRLEVLWELCECAVPPSRQIDRLDDVFDSDPFEADGGVVAADRSDDGWCAEDYFLHHVKSRLMLLVGAYRPGPPHELHNTEAYDTIYDLLINWALHRPCVCCNEQDVDREHASW